MQLRIVRYIIFLQVKYTNMLVTVRYVIFGQVKYTNNGLIVIYGPVK